MAKQKGITVPKKGMDRDKAIFDLDKTEYSFALNANFHDEHGSGQVNLQNEPSNIYCSGFKEGFKVIGHKFDINQDRTYFFLTNPTTGCSEIGYINSFYTLDGIEQVEQDCNCSIQVILENPLESETQKITCSYNTIINDCDCGELSTKCLNFDINYPIHETNIHIKDEFSGKVIYFTDGFNPPRYIQLDRLEIYTQDEDDCTGEVTPTCLNCEDMRIFKLYDKPCLKVDVLQNGGNLRAGLYEAAIAYCTFEGVEISPYYSMTKPTPIFDKNNVILDQTDLNYLTNYSIRLVLSDLDQNYEYVKVAVVYRSGLDGSTTIVSNGVYPIGTKSVTVSTLVDKPILTLNSLLLGKSFYETSRGMANGNGYLYQYGLKAHREINLQPVVNLLGSLVKWSTVQAEEDIYEDGSKVSNYSGYMRDEVYPLAIKFFLDGGYESVTFPFISRPPFDSEVEYLDGGGYDSDTNNESALEGNPDCSGNLRIYRWQFENTASILGNCVVPENPAYGTEVIVETTQNSCFADITATPEATVAVGSVSIAAGSTLVDFINENIDEVLGYTDPSWTDIQTALTTIYAETCEVEFSDNCDEPVLVSEEILALSVETEEVVGTADTSFTSYDRVIPPTDNQTIDIIGFSPTGATPVEDTSFETTYMRPWEIVYERSTYSNSSCASSTSLIPFLNVSPILPNQSWLTYYGALSSLSSLQTSKDVTAVSGPGLPDGYTSKLHTNARWHKVEFLGQTAIVEISTTNIVLSDDVCQESLRVSFFNSCSDTSDIAAYGRIITDMSLANDTDKFFVLDAVDFPSGTAYIALDSNIKTDIEFNITLTGSSGALDIEIDGTTYSISYNSSLSQTATDFLNTHTTPTVLNTVTYDILNGSNNIAVSVSGPTITFRSTEAEYDSLLLTNTSGNLNGTVIVAEEYHVLEPPCGTFNIYTRELIEGTTVNFTNLVFVKKMIYESECSFSVPILNGCDPIPYQYGLFSYWESLEKYPCNDELYDSSVLCVKPSDLNTYLSASEVTEFEDYYTDGLDSDGCYIWKEDTLGKPLVDFRDRGIRHYKFPCSITTPFMGTQNPGAFKDSVLYPIGFSISNDAIKAFLDIAVSNNLITLEERIRINRYEIFRGDRSVDKSIIAKGLLFDIYKYIDGISGGDGTDIPSAQLAYYSNYPLNSLGKDRPNQLPHPYNSTKNNLFSFHSPDTHYYKPFLPREMKLEGYQFGKSQTIFDIVKDHPTYVLLGEQAYSVATALAVTEVSLELALEGIDYYIMASTGTYGIAIGIALAIAATIALIGGVFKAGQLRYQWIEIFYNLGHLNQFAYYSATVGHYNYFLPNPKQDDVLRGIPTIKYVKDGRYAIPSEVGTGIESFNLNNLNREDSVFVNLGSYFLNYPTTYSSYDNYTSNPTSSSRTLYTGIGRSPIMIRNAASPYASLKQYLPSQYGSIQSIDWIHTNYCGVISESLDCDPIFGGDVTISRFAVKRKLPFFTSNSHGLAPRTPFEYSDYFNINPLLKDSRYYIDYLINDDADNYALLFVFPANKSKYNLYPSNSDSGFYIKPPSKFFLFSYGFPYFLVESTINSNFRYAKRERFQDFYPNVTDIIEFTQESNVTIREPNYYYYNFVYSSMHTAYRRRVFPDNYDSVLYAGTENLDNSVIYSRQDSSETSLTDPWLIYNSLDSYTFPKTFGKLINMDSIESEAILARFENGMTMFGSIDQLRDRVTEETANLGQGGIFAGRSINFNKTDLGYAGSQHISKVSCEFGHFWVDAKRGKVFQLEPNAKGLQDITVGLEKWFRENLPFKITQYIPNIPQKDLDNNFKGLGISMGWDARLMRIFITKLDYKPKVSGITFIGGDFYTGSGETLTKIELTDTRFFEKCSFTVAYSPLTQSWISYYSFQPNYYISYNNYFQTGINYSVDSSEEGLWSHLPFLSSYQVFYGKLYPFTIEYGVQSQGSNSTLNSIEYWMDVRKYYSKYDFADVFGYGFNKAYIYNTYQNSGQLNLFHQKNNDLSQSLLYPNHNNDSIDILQSEIAGKWSFNYLYNLIKNERSGLPIWKYDCSQVDKTLDNRLLDYRNSYKDRLRGDYFMVRLQQDVESRFKMIFRFQYDDRTYLQD